MKFNPIRQLFKYDGNVTIKVMHAINPSIQYATISMGNDLIARTHITFPETNNLMNALTEEWRDSITKYARRWKFFYRSDPKRLMQAFLKQYAYSHNPKNK